MKLELVEFHITEHCNLNCKSCIHFSPLAKDEYVKVDNLYKDMRKLYLVAGDRIKEIHILGGEPLLHPNLLKILKNTRKIFKKSKIVLISNGILLLKQKELFWKVLKEEDICLSITCYPIKLDYARISYLTKKYMVKYDFYASSKENSQWHFPLDLKGEQDILFNFANCRKQNNCTNINIKDGKLYLCPICAYVGHFNKYFEKDIPVCDKDYLVLKDIKKIDEIENFISKPSPFCRFCKVKSRTFNNMWDISKRKIEEWT